MEAWEIGHLASKKACKQAEKMCEEIKECIYKYSEEMPLVAALGVLEIVKKEIIDESETE